MESARMDWIYKSHTADLTVIKFLISMLLRIRSLNMREKIMNFLLIFSLALIAKTLADKSFDLECVSVPDRMFTRDPESCRGYILCAGNRIKAKGICPQPFMFNDTTQLCDYPQFVNCNSCKTNIGLQHFVDERNCSNFYKCVDNVRRHFRCADNMYFDYGSSSCLDKSFVFCKDDVSRRRFPVCFFLLARALCVWGV